MSIWINTIAWYLLMSKRRLSSPILSRLLCCCCLGILACPICHYAHENVNHHNFFHSFFNRCDIKLWMYYFFTLWIPLQVCLLRLFLNHSFQDNKKLLITRGWFRCHSIIFWNGYKSNDRVDLIYVWFVSAFWMYPKTWTYTCTL